MFLRRVFALSAAVAVLLPLAAGVPSVQAASATEAQNPDLTVSIAVPDQTSVGQTVAATVVIVNNSSRFQSIVVSGIWTDPAGEATVQSRSGLLFPGQTVTRVVEYLVDERSLPGPHEITIVVEGIGGTSSATTTVEVV